MTPMLKVFPSIPGMMIYTAALVLVILQLAVLLHSVHEKRKSIFSAALLFIISLIVIWLMLFTAQAYKNLDPGEVLVPGSLPDRIFSLPWLVFAAWDILAGIMVFLQIRSRIRYSGMHLTVNAVKEAIDWLPVGVCISDMDGTVLLSNLKINELSKRLTNKHLFDSLAFWEKVTENGTMHGRGYLLRMQDGTAWMFTKKPMKMYEKGRELHYEQIFAEKMTEVCNITDELTARNRHLKEVQYHMKAVAAYERSLITAREVIKARTAVHNHMNSVLLCGKHYLDHPEAVKEEELLHLLEYNNFFQLVESQQRGHRTDVLDDALRNAKRIGVTVQIEGKLPEERPVRDVIAQAVEQCAANTVRHADGDRLNVTITETDSQYIAEFTNNGKPPEEPISETGGLWYLRKAAEEIGASIAVKSEPVFLLTVYIPK
ncbi:hypothetical protein [Ruminococcus sp.]|uniref:hypothetical protein n=1 Tax=Ruminococcus sp. TaxID=41978 RepID=UPI0025E7C9EA|nr:hypothetical protein [Ruminococcus sp.]